jgi:hypothetical protein
MYICYNPAMERDRFFDQIANPDYNEQFRKKLGEVYKLGKSLAQKTPYDRDNFWGSPEILQINFHNESFRRAGFSEKFTGGGIWFIDESPEDDDPRAGSCINIAIERTSKVKNIVLVNFNPGEDIGNSFGDYQAARAELEPTGRTDAVITTQFISIYAPDSVAPESEFMEVEDNSTWPLKVVSTYEDLEGNDVFPIFEMDNTLHAGKEMGVDLEGAELLKKLITIEAELRQVKL